MAKQLNSETGKGYLVSKGQAWVEEYLTTHTQKELAELAGYISKGEPNAGAVSVALKSLGWASFNGQAPVVTAKAVAAPVTAKAVAKPAKAEIDTLPLPGRLEAYFEYRLGWDMTYPVQAHHVELLIRADDVSWNQLALKFGPEEIAMLSELLASEGYCPVGRVSQRGPWYAEQRRLAEQRRIADRIAAIAAIDARLSNQRERFEAARYDADISSFYLA